MERIRRAFLKAFLHRLDVMRMRLLEGEALLARVRRAGVPVVSGSGPGTLDVVLRGLGRRARA